MSKRGWILAVGIVGACALAWNLFADENPRYNVERIVKGLPQNSIIAMTQTRDGYLWLGTLNGLARFDGVHFTVFDESNTPGLGNSRIVKLFEDSRTNLWIGTEGAGVAVARDGKVTVLEETRTGSLSSITEDATGGIWLCADNGQLFRYREPKIDVRLNKCRGVVAEDSGLVWVGTEDGRLVGLGPIQSSATSAFPVAYEVPVGRVDILLSSKRGGFWRLVNGRIQKCKADRVQKDWAYPWSNNVRAAAACEDQEGNLVVGTLGEGVYWFDSEGKAIRLSRELSHNYVLSLAVDREGNLWVGTDGGGLNRVNKQVFDVLADTRGYSIQSVCEDNEGGLWFGSGNLNYLKAGERKQFGMEEGLSDLNVRSVFVDHKRTVWVGTVLGGLFQFHEGVFRRAPGAKAIAAEVSAIHQDRGGRLWVGTQGGLWSWDEHRWTLFTTRDGLSANVVRAIADDREGNLWIGTEGGGLDRFRDGKFIAFTRTNGFPSDNVSSLYADDEGVLWVGTSSGLVRFQGGKWTRYSKEQGLVSNSAGYLLEDGEGNLWIGSNVGLVRAPKRDLNGFASDKSKFIPFRAYGEADGLPTSECTQGSQPAACRTRSGKLWFATIKGLASVDPTQLKRNTNQPPVIIESVLIEGQAQSTNTLRAPLPQAITIPPGKERLEIHYTSLNLAAPERARFRYRMERYEKAWTEAPGDIREAHYSKLPPGEYRFQVKACNEDGVWNEAGSVLGITVEPPFWRTWWFRSAVVLFLLGAIVGVVHYFSTQKLHRQLETLKQQEALEKERARIARDLHDQLGANLTQVALLGELAETDRDHPQEVEAHAKQICQTARETTRALDEIVWTVNPSNDTLDGLINYVCKYAQEYLAVAGLRYRLDVPAQLPATPISPELRHNVFLASKEAITNVVRHARADTASIRLRLEPRRFTLEIEDNGQGLANLGEKAAQRNGLRNMRKRMEDIGGGFSIGSVPDGGTVIRLSAPLGNDKVDAAAPHGA